MSESFGIIRPRPTIITDYGWSAPKPSGIDPSTSAWVAAVVAAGGTVSGTQQGRVDTLTKALKSHSLFTQLDRLWLFAGESVHQQATIDIVNLSVATEHGNLTTTGLGAGGYTGNGTTGYLDTGFDTSTGIATATSAMFGLYMQSGSTPGGQRSGSEGTGLDMINPYEFGSAQFQVNNGFVAAAITHPDGMYVATQTAAAGGTQTGYNFSTLNGNAGSIVSGANATPGIGGTSIYFCAYKDTGAPTRFMTDTLSAGFLGAGLSSSDVAQFATDLNAYMTAWGINRF